MLNGAAVIRVTDAPEALVVEGRLVGPWVDELSRVAIERLRRSGAAPTLDLGAVTYVDDAGVILLRRLLGAGMQVRSSSGFVAELLGRPKP